MISVITAVVLAGTSLNPAETRALAQAVGPLADVAPIRVPSSERWVALTEKKRLVLVARTSNRWRITSSVVVPKVQVETRIELRYYLHASTTEVALQTDLAKTSSGTTAVCHVYGISGNRLRYGGEVKASSGILVNDFNEDGFLDIRNFYPVGSEMSHGQMPRWSDTYSLRGGKLTMVNQGFPKYYSRYQSSIWTLLNEFPEDIELWAWYGKACLATSDRSSPRSSYTKLLSELRPPRKVAGSRLERFNKADRWPLPRRPSQTDFLSLKGVR